ncbi:helix-turn-helix domain-containing protein [Humisphaera borealis]|uniref:Helix-turn-helix transcriptional regulator n=1 Tax=Humisphaera borealis TaxID=2807512 RepID=A0A7M2WVL0_9BACT|nr:helix-turn-helix transcriptional regulator [Humisphaera borealis]QOV89364.1 helix-turn-helix transcriptional regulator [Humisphaera borealis]
MMFDMGNVLDDLRKAMKASEKTRYRLWKETGIDQSHLAKLLNGEAGLSFENMERLAEALGLEIITRPAKRTTAKTKDR